MSYNHMSLRSGWPQAGPKQQLPQHGLPLCGTGYYPESQHAENDVSLTTGEGQSLSNTRSSRSSTLSHVSQYSTPTEPKGTRHSSTANVPATPELLDSPYWQTAVAPAPFPSFASHPGDSLWEHAHHGVNPSLLEYGHHTLGVNTSMLPQTVFRPGEALHNLSLPPLVEKHSNTDSKLFASSDMLEAMVLDDDPGPSRWNVPTQAAYEGPRCVELSESDVTSSTWADDTDEKTVSPKMLRLRRTPSPSTSSESLHTSFMVGANHPLPSIETSPCQVANVTVPTKKARKQLPDRASWRDMSGRQSPIGSEPPSPRRKLTRLRPKPRSGPSPSSAPLGMLPLSPGGTERIELSDRMSKDDFLVRQKQMGMTYKEIRRIGGFTEAESTLRGRYRTLTKSREARVRKPEWSEKDLRLLEKAVRTLAHTSDLNPSKIPWKKVAEHIVAHGGSYHFGNSTCRKRWDELVREQAALGKTIRQEFFEGGMEVEFEGGGLGGYFQGAFVGGGGGGGYGGYGN